MIRDAQRDQGVDETQIVERFRAQLAGDSANLVEAVADGIGDASELRRRRRGIARGGALGLERDGREGLPDLVVELPRDSKPFRLLGGQRSSGRFMARPLQAVEHRVERRGKRLALGAAWVYLRPAVKAVAEQENRVLVRCRPYATFVTPPRHLHSNDQQELTHWVSASMPWDASDTPR